MSDNTTKTTPAATPTTHVVCWCGCGGLTKSKFVQGHDSKFHSRAKQVLRGTLNLDEELAKLPHQESRDEFVRYMESQRDNEAARSQKLAVKAAESAKKKADAAAKKAADLAKKANPVVEPKPVVDGTPGEGEGSTVENETAITA